MLYTIVRRSSWCSLAQANERDGLMFRAWTGAALRRKWLIGANSGVGVGCWLDRVDPLSPPPTCCTLSRLTVNICFDVHGAFNLISTIYYATVKGAVVLAGLLDEPCNLLVSRQ